MIDFYYNFGPNPVKVALFLEEAGLEYRPIPVDMLRGEQFDAAFATLNPNNKVPVIVDDGTVVFDSSAILLYLAQKTGQFLGPPDKRADLLSWLMFVATGVGPYAGQAVHFRHFAPEPRQYGVDRYLFEARRHFGIVDQRLGEMEWMLGEDYSILDMALWGWARNIVRVVGEDAPERFPNIFRFLDSVANRPAALRVDKLREANSFATDFDENARRHLFRQLVK